MEKRAETFPEILYCHFTKGSFSKYKLMRQTNCIKEMAD